MYVNGVQQDAASKNYTGMFYTELENNPAPAWVQLVFRIVFAIVRQQIFAFTKGVAGLREWIGERRVKSLSEYSIIVKKKNWELTFGIDRDSVMFDGQTLNLISDAITGLAQSVPRHFVQFFAQLCLGGFTAPAYDGANFFDANHPNGAGVNSNTTNVALSAAAWEAAKVAAGKWVNTDTGNPLLIRYTHLFYGIQSEAAQLQTFGAPQLAGGATNVYYNAIPAENRILVQEFGDTAKWFLFDLSKLFKPFALLIVKGMDFVAFDKPTDWIVFSENEYVYGVDTMDNAGYMLPEVAYGSSIA